MPHEFTLRRMVEFAETDMAGIMHFANYFRFMEATEHAFFRALGLVVHAPESGPTGAAPGAAARPMQGWARVHAECTYDEPLRYQDLVDVHLTVREKRTRSITYDFVFRRADGEPDRPVARGSMTTVCVTRPPGAAELRAAPIPTEVHAAIAAAVEGDTPSH